MDSLRSLSSPTARLIRSGQQVTVPSAEVVPGDVIEVKVGDTIPADIRSVQSAAFLAPVFLADTFRLHQDASNEGPMLTKT